MEVTQQWLNNDGKSLGPIFSFPRGDMLMSQTSSVIQLDLLSSLDTGYIWENHLQVVWPMTLTFYPSSSSTTIHSLATIVLNYKLPVNGSLRHILYLMKKAGLVQLQNLFTTFWQLYWIMLYFLQTYILTCAVSTVICLLHSHVFKTDISVPHCSIFTPWKLLNDKPDISFPVISI